MKTPFCEIFFFVIKKSLSIWGWEVGVSRNEELDKKETNCAFWLKQLRPVKHVAWPFCFWPTTGPATVGSLRAGASHVALRCSRPHQATKTPRNPPACFWATWCSAIFFFLDREAAVVSFSSTFCSKTSQGVRRVTSWVRKAFGCLHLKIHKSKNLMEIGRRLQRMKTRKSFLLRENQKPRLCFVVFCCVLLCLFFL